MWVDSRPSTLDRPGRTSQPPATMCYFLYIASPLTLSEVRSMLPSGLSADLASFSDQQAMKAIHPEAQTVARILAGRCSCDLVRRRLADTKEDERHLRQRYRSLGISRATMIAALERHRQGAGLGRAQETGQGWLAKFIAEHARNAGPTLYYLYFSAATDRPPRLGDTRRIQTADVIANPGDWLEEGSPTLVIR